MFVFVDITWMIIILVLGFFLCIVLSVAVGANCVAGAYAAPVGARVISMRQARVCGAIFAVMGAMIIGARVSHTAVNGAVDVDLYVNGTGTYMIGNVAAMCGTCVWVISATCAGLPISATHSLVGGTVGFTLVVHGGSGVNWASVAMTLVSAIISPVLSGAISVTLLRIVCRLVLPKNNPLARGLRCLPGLYAIAVFVGTFATFYDGPELLGFDKIPLWGAFALSASCSLIFALLAQFFLVPRLRSKFMRSIIYHGPSIELREQAEGACGEDDDEEALMHDTNSTRGLAARITRPQSVALFSCLIVTNAALSSFNTGGSEVSNAIGPLTAVWLLRASDTVHDKVVAPIWLLFYGGIGMSLGVSLLGHRLIRPMGHNVTRITPPGAFCIELGAALTVLVASSIGVPISLAHCRVGGIVLVGCHFSRRDVNWRVVRRFVIGWTLTPPVAGGVAVLVMAAAQHFTPGHTPSPPVGTVSSTPMAVEDTAYAYALYPVITGPE